MDNDDILLAAVAAGIVLYIYNDVKQGVKDVGYVDSVNKAVLSQRIENAGGTVKETSLGTFYNIPGGVIKLPEQTQLRRWESALIAIDRIVPGDFLTRYALS